MSNIDLAIMILVVGQFSAIWWRLGRVTGKIDALTRELNGKQEK